MENLKNTIENKTRPKMGIVLLLISILSFFFSPKVDAVKIVCDLFDSKKEAQEAFDSNPKVFKMLDRDHDGKACE